MHAVAAFFAGILAAVSGLFGNAIVAAPTSHPVSQVAAAAIATEPASAPTSTPATVSPLTPAPPPPPSQTIINKPVIERIVERAVPQAGATISTETLTAILADFERSITARIGPLNPLPANIPAQVAAGGNAGSYSFFPASQRIDQLTSTAINTPTITGGSISGASVSGYLPLSGGTLSGGLTGTDLNLSGTLTAGALSVSALSSGGAVIGPYINATSSIATSTFAGSLTVSGTATISNLVTQGPRVDIRAYGAKCDGATDDTTAINAAMSAAAASGGTVVSSIGTCIHQSLTVSSPMTIELASSTWKLKGSSTGNQINIASSNVTIHGGTLDGDSANSPSAGSGVMLGAGISDITIKGVSFRNHTYSNIRSKGSTGPVNSRIHVVGNTFSGAGSAAVFFNWETQDSEITDNHFLAGANNAVWVGNNSSNVRVTRNFITGYTRMGIEMTNSASRALIKDNIIRIPGSGTDAFGISLGGATSSIIAGNSVELTSPASANIGIEIVTSDNSLVEGNNIINAGVGISVDKTSDSIINNNRVSAFSGTAAIQLVSSSATYNIQRNLIENNRITITQTSGNPGGIHLQPNVAGVSADNNQIAGNTIVGQTSSLGGGVGVKLYAFGGSLANTLITGNIFRTLNIAIDHSSDTGTQQALNVYDTLTTTQGGSAGNAASNYFDDGLLRIATRFSNAKLNFAGDNSTALIATTRSDGTFSGTINTNGWGQFYTSSGFGVGGAPANGSGNLYVANNIGVGTTTPWGKLSVTGSGTSTGLAFAVADSANTPRFVIQDNGNVGIGTTNPGQLFVFQGSDTSQLLLENTTPATSCGTACGAQASPELRLNGKIWNSSTGNVTMSSYLQLNSLTNNANPSVSKLSFFVGTDNASPVEQMWISSQGNFNIAGGGSIGGGVDFASSSLSAVNDVKIRNTAPATSGAPQNSNKLVFEGRAWNSSQGNIAQQAYFQLLNSSNNVNPVISRFGVFLQTGTNGGATIERFSIANDGNAGVGTLGGSPTAKLVVNADNGDANTNIFVVASSTASATTTLLTVNNTGSVGIGTSSPTAQLHTTGTVRFSNFGAGTLTTDASGNLSVSSDERLKDIDGPFTRGLADILKLSPISYHWNPASGLDQTTQYSGFSAQNVQQAIPEAVGSSTSGYLTLQDRPLIAAIVNAIKEITSITGAFRDHLIAWFGDTTNGIGHFFAADITATHKLCVDDVCVTREQFAAMVAAAGHTSASPATQSQTSIDFFQAPIIELNGNATSTVTVGDTYLDLGARIVSPAADLNLGITTLLDGATTTAVSIDTSSPGEHTILYTVTDPQGLTGSATRTIIVSPVTQPPATSTPPANDNASSTQIAI